MRRKIGCFLVLLCMVVESSFGMHKAIVVGSKVFAGAVTIGLGIGAAGMKKKMAEDLNDSLINPHKSVKAFYNEEMDKLWENGAVYDRAELKVAKEVQIVPFARGGWASSDDTYIVIPKKLNDALRELLDLANSGRIKNQDQKDELEQALILQKNMLRCVVGHQMAEDDLRLTKVALFCPIAVQFLSSFMMRNIRSFFSIQPSKTVLSTFMRSSASIIGIVPKAFLSIFMIGCFVKKQNCDALAFACQQAESKKELLALYKISYNERENKEIAQYLIEWEKNN